MKTLSIKQPWASLIITEDEQNPGFGIKPIENRTWPCPQKYIGQRVLIHASAKPATEPYMLFNDEQSAAIDDIIIELCSFYDLKGSIIGSVEIVGCEINHKSIWAEETEVITDSEFGYFPVYGKKIYNWILANPVKFETPIPAKGKLSFWESGIEICPDCFQPLYTNSACIINCNK